jgi:hypothetical protein
MRENTPKVASRWAGGESPDLFLDRALPLLGWSSLLPTIGAVEARLGMPVSIALFKMTLLERWFQLSSAELDDACHGRSAFRRFLDAPLHGPVAEVWMYRQLKPKLAGAEHEIGALIAAVESMLAGRGLPPPTCSWTGAETAVVAQANEGIRTTVLEPGRLSAIAAEAEWVARFGQGGHGDGIQGLPGAAHVKTAAMLLWPWRASTPVDRVLRVGRDPEFSPFARQLWADTRISRRHAELEPHARSVLLRDLGSSNGTYLNDEPLPRRGSIVLEDDAQLRFGTNLAVKLVFFPSEPHGSV